MLGVALLGAAVSGMTVLGMAELLKATRRIQPEAPLPKPTTAFLVEP